MDANKGLQLADLPYILTLQLKRFDFDYTTMRRIKITERVTFPEVLDLAPYVANPARPQKRRLSLASPSASASGGRNLAAVDDARAAVDAADRAGRKDSGGDIQSPSPCTDGQAPSSPRSKAGPDLYDLYSVMVHSGSAFGGHYYAYIKDVSTDEWYKFNDATVTPATWRDVEGTFGGAGGGSVFSSAATAYMLMYRKRDPLNRSHVDDEAVPQLLRDALEQREAVAREELEAERLKRNAVTLTVWHGLFEGPLVVQKGVTLRELKNEVRRLVPSLKGVSDDCMRLRKYLAEKDMVSSLLGDAGGTGVEEDDRAVQGIEYDTNIAVEIRGETLPPWPPVPTGSAHARQADGHRSLPNACL